MKKLHEPSDNRATLITIMLLLPRKLGQRVLLHDNNVMGSILGAPAKSVVIIKWIIFQIL